MTKTSYNEVSLTEKRMLATMILIQASGTRDNNEHQTIADKVRLLSEFHINRIVEEYREIIVDYSPWSKKMRFSRQLHNELNIID